MRIATRTGAFHVSGEFIMEVKILKYALSCNISDPAVDFIDRFP